ncbi:MULTISPECIES: helix-turn-helix domain-containing protein [Brevundimonas]|uniref:helix-turn-helix domain-containing protein n=1 Tax=Brevundimonas TaxID=41275 RepID=UPI003208AC6D
MTFVAENVRTRRARAGLNQKALAQASGVSLRMIGAIEAGATSASTATLDRIGIALGATLSDLVRDPNTRPMMEIDRLGWTGDHGGEGFLRWSVPVSKEVETWEWRLEPGDRYQAAPDPEGWRVMLFVLEGRLTLELGDDLLVLEHAGHLFDSAQRHAFRNDGQQTVRFFRCTTW